ncbi:sugar phosphate isomerase/epimerase family protein [Streptomyces sp. NPDC055109]
MRLAFSTLGVPGMPLHQVHALALRTGWTGLELLSSSDEPLHIGLDAAARRAAREELAQGVTPVSINSYIHIGTSRLSDDEVVEATLAQALLAHDIGATAVRVFPGGDAPRSEDCMVDRLREAADLLPEDVELWLETHDSHSTGRDVSRVLDRVGSGRVRAIWDLAHPVHSGEQWQQTLDALRPHLAHVQIKDEGAAGEPPVPLGRGNLPLAPTLNALVSEGYHGWFSLEWERKWFPEADPLEEVLTKANVWIQANVHHRT